MPGSDPASGSDFDRLVDAARGGDRGAFNEIVRATYADTFTLACRLTGNEEDARDVTQDTYLRAYQGIGKFRGEAAVTSWLYRITANCASSHLARRGKHRHEPLEHADQVIDAAPEHDPQQRAVGADLRRDLEAAIAQLPDRLRVVVVLRDVYDLPHDAIAAELGITETAAKVRLHRARRALRERLFPRAAEEADRAV